LPDWPHRLGVFVSSRLQEPFAWGANDCVSFAAAAVQRMTGANPLEDVQPWASARQAYRELRARGGIVAIVEATGLEQVPALMAQRGDVVLLRPPSRAGSVRGTLGICLGDVVAAPAAQGLVMAGLSEGHKAWRV
jgi:hypothetical protein